MKSVTIILICALAFGLSFFACDPKAEKIKAYNDLISTSTFQDTVITYSLFSDSLILKLAKEPRIKHWYGEIFLIKSDSDDILYIPFPNKTKEKMGHLTIKKNTLTFSGFHIPSDSLHRYIIHFRAVPWPLGFLSTGEIYKPGYLFYSELDGSNKLKITDLVHDFTITSFDLVKLKNMPPALRDFCRDSIERAFYMRITDAEIEESKY